MEWINVKDRLPKEEKNYIVTVLEYVHDDFECGSVRKKSVYACAWYDSKFNKWHIEDVECNNLFEVIAWMPYPEPYE